MPNKKPGLLVMPGFFVAPGVCSIFLYGSAEKFRPWNFSARCGAVHARAALPESMADALDSGRGILPHA
jgi:hypothetical protein